MRERKRRLAVRAGLLALVGALAIVAAGCGGDDGGGSAPRSRASAPRSRRSRRWRGRRARSTSSSGPGYAQLTKEFTEATGCTVNTKDGGSSDDMISLIQTGEYDGVSASGQRERPPDGHG